MSIIAIHQLGKSFNGTVAVRDVGLDVAEGEFLTLLGPSGCGKTTLLRMIAGFETPTVGKIRIGGKDMTAVPPNKREINTVFQDYALFPHMSVARNVAFGLSVAGVARGEIDRRVGEALSLVELAHRSNAMPHQLSGGQRQRVALARALVKRPKVLLLDEPLSALDASLRQQMQVELKRLQQKLGITFIMVTHDQEEAMVMSDRIAVMQHGRIEQVGAPIELYDRPHTAFVASFFGASTLVSGRADRNLKGELSVTSADGLELRCTDQEGLGILPGRDLTVSVRPEKVACFAPDHLQDDDRNHFDGVVQAVFFHGSSVRLQVQVRDTVLLTDVSRQRAAHSAVPVAAGSRVKLSIAPDDIIILRHCQTVH
ncbi:ABC transporter ATP-binding protein [Paraburkholderia sp. GAS334]|uniref:ABC transporter ATP-binding protein n=1 Tax=Paraburkholderia sp. GAS334 TaxID=3035131 RepID=UPI003D238C84